MLDGASAVLDFTNLGYKTENNTDGTKKPPVTYDKSPF
jgi:hypothetical protein